MMKTKYVAGWYRLEHKDLPPVTTYLTAAQSRALFANDRIPLRRHGHLFPALYLRLDFLSWKLIEEDVR